MKTDKQAKMRTTPEKTKTQSTEEIGRLIDAAVTKRASLVDSGATNAVRLVHDSADGLGGIVIERFDTVLIVQHHEDRSVATVAQLKSLIADRMQQLGATAVYLKLFLRDRANAESTVADAHRDAAPWIGEPAPEEMAISEHGALLGIRPYDGFSTGLFLEHRNNRRSVRDMSNGLTVLNLYAYTCGFSVAAALGGAASVTSVDLSKRYLDWGRRNFERNSIPVESHRFHCDDAMDFLRRAAKQQRDYDFIVVDPPTFARMRRPKRVFVLRDSLDALTSAAVDRLRPGGTLLFATNDRGITRKSIETSIYLAADGRRVKTTKWPRLPIDFAGDEDFSKAIIARFD